MKRLLSVMLILSLTLAFFACGEKKESKNNPFADTAQDAAKTTEPVIETEPPEETEPASPADLVEVPEVTFTNDLSAFEEYMDPADRDGFLILANKEHELGESYIPADLVEIANTRQDGRATAKMVKTAAKALEALYLEMYSAGYTDVSVTSAYRSYADQKYIFDGFYNQNLAAGYDEETALAMVLSDTAAPGTSEHQTGLCCDMHNYPSATTEFKNEAAYTWLCDNAWKFGFILRYPEDKVDITGYTFEPWHYRFVGRYHAAKIHALGICLEEYLDMIGS
ncbi:MAG: M15 family metallopeptidase [Clostridia bacterium]|nr:M15 family metallopeptidase [Clostridia bacterium]